MAANGFEQHFFIDRFHQVFGGAQRQTDLRFIDHGDHNHGNGGGDRRLLQLVERVPAAFAGHEHVQGNGIRHVFGGLGQGLRRRTRGNQLIPLGLQPTRQEFAGGGLVVHYQNQWAVARRPHLASAGVLGRGIFRLGAAGRHGESEPRALVRLTLHPDAPAVFLHQALGDGQSEAGPFLNAFGGGSRLVEGIENSFPRTSGRSRGGPISPPPASSGAASSDWARPAGMVKLSRAPLFGSLSTQMRPPCSSTKRLLMASPRPVPSLMPLVVAPAWWNASKTASCSSMGIPRPVSLTETVRRPRRSVASTQILPPSGVNLTALLSRLNKICLNRMRSAKTVTSGPMLLCTAMLLAAAAARMLVRTSARTVVTGTFSRLSSRRPASTFERSRMSLINASRCRAPCWM